jgi:hypothetical protein
MKKVRCSYLGAKVSAKIIILSDKEGVTPRPKRAKTSGLVPKARKVMVEVGKSADSTAELLEAIHQQNSMLRELLIFQEQTALATSLRGNCGREQCWFRWL